MKTSTDNPTSLLSLFLTTPASDHRPRNTTGDVEARKIGPVMVVGPDESIPRVFRKLVVEGFLSAPVVQGTRYLGFIDMMDLVCKTRDIFWADTVEAWCNFWDKEERFQLMTVDDCMKTPSQWNRDPSPPLTENFTTFSALELMVRGNHHRLAVTVPGSPNKVSCILTQSMLISWLRQNEHLFGTLRTMLVSDIVDQVCNKECRTIKETDKAINAFNIMANENISGLAVVDQEGLLQSGISIRDLRTVGTSGEYFHRLFRPIRDFKQIAREEHPKLAPRTHYMRKALPKTGLFVTPSGTFGDVLKLMADGNIHRVFVCESATRPVPTHVISQVDVLKIVLENIVDQAEASDLSVRVGAAG